MDQTKFNQQGNQIGFANPPNSIPLAEWRAKIMGKRLFAEDEVGDGTVSGQSVSSTCLQGLLSINLHFALLTFL